MSDTMKAAGKYHINLYRDELRPQKTWMSLNLLVIILVALFLLTLLSRVVLAWQENQLGLAYQSGIAASEQVRQERDRLLSAVQEQQVDRDLERRLRELEESNSSLQRMVDAARLPVEDNSRLYSGLLRDLSTVHQSGLTLSLIENRNGQLRFEGEASQASYLPEWMARFDHVDTLSGRQFAVVSLEENSKSTFYFALRSQRDSQQSIGQRREGSR